MYSDRSQLALVLATVLRKQEARDPNILNTTTPNKTVHNNEHLSQASLFTRLLAHTSFRNPPPLPDQQILHNIITEAQNSIGDNSIQHSSSSSASPSDALSHLMGLLSTQPTEITDFQLTSVEQIPSLLSLLPSWIHSTARGISSSNNLTSPALKCALSLHQQLELQILKGIQSCLEDFTQHPPSPEVALQTAMGFISLADKVFPLGVPDWILIASLRIIELSRNPENNNNGEQATPSSSSSAALESVLNKYFTDTPSIPSSPPQTVPSPLTPFNPDLLPHSCQHLAPLAVQYSDYLESTKQQSSGE